MDAAALLPQPGDAAPRQSYAVIRIDRELVGLGLDAVREFVHLRDVVPVPCCPAHILGNMNLRGDVLTVVDIRPVLGLTPEGETPEVVVLARDLRVGIAAAEIVEVLHVVSSDIGPATLALNGSHSDYCRGIALFNGRTVTLLDLERLFASGALSVDESVV